VKIATLFFEGGAWDLGSEEDGVGTGKASENWPQSIGGCWLTWDNVPSCRLLLDWIHWGGAIGFLHSCCWRGLNSIPFEIHHLDRRIKWEIVILVWCPKFYVCARFRHCGVCVCWGPTNVWILNFSGLKKPLVFHSATGRSFQVFRLKRRRTDRRNNRPKGKYIHEEIILME
jgi:hypothetical protein